LWELLKFTRPG